VDHAALQERVRAKRFIKNLLPTGTVEETLLSVLKPACLATKEENKNRPVAAQFAAARLARQRQQGAMTDQLEMSDVVQELQQASHQMNEMHNRMLRQEQVIMQLQQDRAQEVQIHTP